MQTSIFGAIFMAMLAAPLGASAGVTEPINVYFGNFDVMPHKHNAPPDVARPFRAAVIGVLVIVDENFNLQPGLLQRFFYDYEKKGYILKLKEGLKFHNGREVTATDVEFGLVRGLYSKTNNYWRIYVQNILGAEQVVPGTPFKSGDLAGVKVLDKNTLLVKLAYPNPSFLNALAASILGPVPREELEDDLMTWKKWPVGAGPFRVASVDEKLSEIIIENTADKSSFRLMYGAAPRVEPDVSLDALPKLTEYVYPKPNSVLSFYLSTHNAFTKKRDLRLKIANLFDRGPLKAKFPKIVAEELLPPIFWGRANVTKPDAPQHPPILPKELTVHVLVKGDNTPMPDLHQAAVDQLKKALEQMHIQLKVVANSNRERTETDLKNFGFELFRMSADYVDPLIMFNAFAPGSAIGITLLGGEPTFRKLFEEARNKISQEERIESIRNLSSYIVKEGYVIPALFSYTSVFYGPRITFKDTGPFQGYGFSFDQVSRK